MPVGVLGSRDGVHVEDCIDFMFGTLLVLICVNRKILNILEYLQCQ